MMTKAGFAACRKKGAALASTFMCPAGVAPPLFPPCWDILRPVGTRRKCWEKKMELLCEAAEYISFSFDC